ncbi:MAG: ATP synthase F1 subunit epsilon [Alphaproteobacteria bacterium]|nr:ATP synthase F1 subunit epsilon [Alphaproteobacteria bacterium]MCZ6764105.1 ATP synthase F1 subunit epsilon [Alphaproteobacteria bacterium]
MVEDNKVEFELVAPEQIILSEPVEMVVVPGEEGDFGVLPGHSHLISNIRPGVIHVFADSQVQARIFVAGGFAEVTPDRCVVLAEEAMAVDDIDREAIDREIGELNDDLKDADDAITRALVENKLKVAHAKIEASQHLLYQ